MCIGRYRGYLKCRHADPTATPLRPLECSLARRLKLPCGRYAGWRVLERMDAQGSVDRQWCPRCRAPWAAALRAWDDELARWRALLPRPPSDDHDAMFREFHLAYQAVLRRVQAEACKGPDNISLVVLQREMARLIDASQAEVNDALQELRDGS